MKKLLVSMLCGGILFGGLIAPVANASEIVDERVQTKSTNSEVSTRAFIDGKPYKFVYAFGKKVPPKYFKNSILVHVRTDKAGIYYGYYA